MQLESIRIIFKTDKPLFYRMVAEAQDLDLCVDELDIWARDVLDDQRQAEAYFGAIDGTHDAEGNRYDSPSLDPAWHEYK